MVIIINYGSNPYSGYRMTKVGYKPCSLLSGSDYIIRWFGETFHEKCRLMRGDAVAACKPHKLEVVGSIPTPRN